MEQQIGWGIVGTPQGCKFLREGLSKEKTLLNFDLAQNIGNCLPEPDNVICNEFIYCLKYEVICDGQQQHLIGLAAYTIAAGIDGYRAGNYFGAFIESVDSILCRNP